MSLNLKLHYQQSKVFQTNANEILYGGAAGGGKSHLMRVVAIMLGAKIENLQVYLFRRLSDDLHKNHMEGPGGFFALLSSLIDTKFVKYDGQKHVLKFWNGSKIWLCHCQYLKDLNKYQGTEIHVLLMDELTHFLEPMYKFLRGRCRVAGLKIPGGIDPDLGINLKQKLPLIITGSNPGNIGHMWVKREFVDIAPPMQLIRMPKTEGGKLRQFVPAKLEDNPTLMENDPEYENSLLALGDPILVRAMRYGDWDIVAGGVIDDLWRRDKHTVPMFAIPWNWPMFRSFDWGSAKPFSVGWWAVANGEEVYYYKDGDIHKFCPYRGSLVRFYEWYGTRLVGSNAGIRLTSDRVARGILAREKMLKTNGIVKSIIRPGPADSSIYDVNDDESDSIANKMKREKVTWVKADKRKGSRLNGLELFRGRLRNTLEGEGPGIYFTENCNYSIATLPPLKRDDKNIEDVDTEAEDHIYDEVRYTCLFMPRKPATSKNLKVIFP